MSDLVERLRAEYQAFVDGINRSTEADITASERARLAETQGAMEPPTIEALARAICRAGGRDPDYCVHGSGDTSGRYECYRRAWKDSLPAAHAAAALFATPPAAPLAGAVEPTEATVEATERGVLEALSAGHKIAYSQDGDNAWLHPRHPFGFLPDTLVIELRRKSWIKNEPWDDADDNGRFGPGDVISEAGHAALRSLKSKGAAEC